MVRPDETADVSAFDEHAAVIGAQRGDREAFGALVQAYQRRAYAVAYGFVRNRDDALEIAQESFVRAYKAMRRFDPKMPFYPWLHRIIRNACLNHLKKKRRHGETSLEGLREAGHDIEDRSVALPSAAVTLEELRTVLAAALDRLTPDHREIIVLRHFENLPYADIARCLGIPPGTVMSRLHAARRRLRDIVAEYEE